MKPDDFEQELTKARLRPVPPGWRAEILEAAFAAAESAIATPNAHPSSWWREWLWPCPQAWAGLAAVWGIILTLQLTNQPDRGSSFAGSSGKNPTGQPATFSTERRELVRLLDNASEATPSTSPARPAPGPRSERPSPPRA